MRALLQHAGFIFCTLRTLPRDSNNNYWGSRIQLRFCEVHRILPYFSKMGEDAYDLSKKGLASLVTRIRRPINRATVLEFVFPFDGFDVHAFLETRSQENANYALAHSSEMVALLDAAKSANRLPRANQIEFQYDEDAKHWKFRRCTSRYTRG